jgi:hypothetical protein
MHHLRAVCEYEHALYYRAQWHYASAVLQIRRLVEHEGVRLPDVVLFCRQRDELAQTYSILDLPYPILCWIEKQLSFNQQAKPTGTAAASDGRSALREELRRNHAA